VIRAGKGSGTGCREDQGKWRKVKPRFPIKKKKAGQNSFQLKKGDIVELVRKKIRRENLIPEKSGGPFPGVIGCQGII